MSRRYASRRYAGGLGPSRIRTRIPTTRQLGQWVSLRKTLRFCVRLQLSLILKGQVRTTIQKIHSCLFTLEVLPDMTNNNAFAYPVPGTIFFS